MTELGATVSAQELRDWRDLLAGPLRHFAARAPREDFASPIIPVGDYLKLHYLEAWERWPAMMRRINERVPIQELAAAVREPGHGLSPCHIWSTSAMFRGRELWEQLGSATADDDAFDRYATVYDFWRQSSEIWRGDGFLNCYAAGDVARPYPANLINQLAASARGVSDDDQRNWTRRLSTLLMQYAFLMHLEVRLGATDTGPYPLPGGKVTLIREYTGVGPGSFDWTPTESAIPEGPIVFVLVLRPGVRLNVNDIATTQSEPTDMFDHVGAVGWFTRKGDGSLVQLSDDQLQDLEQGLRRAMKALYADLVKWPWHQKVAAGAHVHLRIIKPWAAAAGVAEELDWSAPVAVSADKFALIPELPLQFDRFAALSSVADHRNEDAR